MHIDATTHEHGVNAKVYTYEADFDSQASQVQWTAVVHHADAAPRTLQGTIPISSPAASVVAEQAVRDAVVKAIDALDLTA